MMNDLSRAIGELTGEVRALRRDVQEDRQTAATYRQGVRQELSQFREALTAIDGEVAALKRQVATHEMVTAEVATLRTKAQGAGTAGRLLLRAGIGLVTFVGWVFGLYTWWTGRPPP